MRRAALNMSLPVLVLCLAAGTALAEKKGGGGRSCASGRCGAGQCGGGNCGGLFGAHNRFYEGRDTHFNCGCNGSYKYPVPPLSTYHWPGMFSHQLMTDYHSPWRFPPLKPYTDEDPRAEAALLRPVRQASAQSTLPSKSNNLRMSERMQRYFR